MIKVAVLCSGDVLNRKGLLNAVHERVLRLQKYPDVQVEVFAFLQLMPKWITFIRGHKVKHVLNHDLYSDGVNYHIRPFVKSLLDYILQNKFGCAPLSQSIFNKTFETELSGFDILDVHSMDAHILAVYLKSKYDLPYIVNWHGSDMHTYPFKNKFYYRRTATVLHNADCNAFVSSALIKIANTITPIDNSQLLFNGISSIMKKYPEAQRRIIRHNLNPKNNKIVAFAGGLHVVKNVELFASIFSKVMLLTKENIDYWIIGDGPMRAYLEADLKKHNVDCKLWGSQQPDKMPDFLNCVDVLILPSKNEGTPLIIMEAIKCGAKVVASDVGGVAECIGKQNVVPFGEDFIERFTERIVFLLENDVKQNVPNQYDWDTSVNIEYRVINEIVLKQ